MKNEYFSLQTFTFHMPKNLCREDERYQNLVNLFKSLAVVHHRCIVNLLDDNTEEEIFRTIRTESIEECFCNLYQIPSTQLKTIECKTSFTGRSKVTCTFVIPQCPKEMSQLQIQQQTARVVTVNRTELQVGFIADAVNELFSSILYQQCSYYLNIDLDGSEIGLNEAALLCQCCQMVINVFSEEILKIYSTPECTDHLSQILEQILTAESNEIQDKKGLHDLEPVKKRLKWALRFAEGEYWWKIRNDEVGNDLFII